MKNNILFVAHPDDEVLFFSGPLNRYGEDFHVVLVTDGNADGKGNIRLKEFEKSLKQFNVHSFETYLFEDIYEKEIDSMELERRIKETLEKYSKENSRVYTHGPFGEYGHPHHIQVSKAVHTVAQAKYSIRHPNVLDLPGSAEIYDDSDLYQKKLNILTSIYRNEFSRFVTLLAPKMSEKHLSSEDYILEITEVLIG